MISPILGDIGEQMPQLEESDECTLIGASVSSAISLNRRPSMSA